MRNVFRIEHKQEVLEWNAGFYKPGSFDLFEHINEFIAGMPMADQDLMFDIYKDISAKFDVSNDVVWIMTELVTLSTMLLDMIDLTKLRTFLVFRGIHIPPSIPEHYVEDIRRPKSQEKTYTQPDYKDLLALTVGTRVMLPIWGRFIDTTKGEAGSQFKEINALQLIGRSAIYRSPAMTKLQSYISHNVPQNRQIDGQRRQVNWQTIVINGMGRDKFDFWVLAQTLIRKIAITDIRDFSFSTNANLISFIYSFISSKLKNVEPSSRTDTVQYKEVARSGENSGGGDAEGSYFENILVQTTYSSGDIFSIRFFCSRPELLYAHFCKNHKLIPDYGLLNTFLAHANWLDTVAITRDLVNIAKVILCESVHPKGLQHVIKKEIINVLAVAQTACWQMGFKSIAVALTSRVKDETGGEYIRTRTDMLVLNELDASFPHRKYVGRDRTVNVAANWIDYLDKALTPKSWSTNLPTTVIGDTISGQDSDRYLLPVDFKFQLGRLLIQLDKKQPLS
jgi:hypothetical protein